jgi:2-alkyl-3-oxoalkanoate reductase
MRILVAGASGAIGKTLVPALVKRGHTVAGIIRSVTNSALVEKLGATPVTADALDPAAVLMAFRAFRPDVVIHQLTAIPANPNLFNFDKVFALTNRLRTEGTDNLLAAARASGVRRFVAQSFCGWPYQRTGGPIKTEEDPLDSDPPRQLRRTLHAIKYVERQMEMARDVHGISLRYGGLYGPGTSLSTSGGSVEQVRKRWLPIIGDGKGVWSFIHVRDVASATVAAAESDITGTFNVVDDEPAVVAEWLPFLARSVGAKPPFRIPLAIARLLLPKHIVVMMNEIRGGSNEKFKKVFDWRLSISTWREGFQSGL